jgi:hypothetical protein
MLFIYDYQTKIFKNKVFLYQGMGSYNKGKSPFSAKDFYPVFFGLAYGNLSKAPAKIITKYFS